MFFDCVFSKTQDGAGAALACHTKSPCSSAFRLNGLPWRTAQTLTPLFLESWILDPHHARGPGSKLGILAMAGRNAGTALAGAPTRAKLARI